MRKENSTVLAAVSLAVILAACAKGPRASDTETLNSLQKEVDAAIIAGDTERYVALITDDAVLMPPNSPPVIGKESIRSWNQAMSKQFRIQSYASVDDEVIVAGGWAFRRATADWTLVPAAHGTPIREAGKYIIIYQRQADGSWKVARDIWNSNTKAR